MVSRLYGPLKIFPGGLLIPMSGLSWTREVTNSHDRMKVNISERKSTSLGESQHIWETVNISGRKLTSLGEGQHLWEKVNISGRKLTSLGEGQHL
ncbi:hypothetical protein ElyMa_002519700 [Elysia marginata]|uniref:Uncharacterized protein n=1 Tax=Elysia marginata TaxID=1093978 RepID=A0AAV4GSJ7_9GAST|nr:hypothetical protein ElyMa_002519700 [Elysia marginata]